MTVVPSPGAKGLTAAQLANNMAIAIFAGEVMAQASMGVLAQYFAGTSGGTPVATALNTVGAGTITAAGITSKITVRGGAQSNTAFADTTDTAAAIIARIPNAYIGQSFLYFVQNTTDAAETIGGGTGVTVSGISVVPAKSTVMFLVTLTSLTAVTMVGLSQTLPTVPNGTFTANGASAVTVTDSRFTANSVVVISLKTVGGTVGVQPHLLTATPGTGFTVSGTASDTSIYNYLILN